MNSQVFRWAAIAACASALTVAWIMTDTLGGWVILPLLASLTAAGLLIAGEPRAPLVAIVAGVVQASHASLLLAGGHTQAIAGAYLASAVGLLVCGLVLRRRPPPPVPAEPGPDLDDRPL